MFVLEFAGTPAEKEYLVARSNFSMNPGWERKLKEAVAPQMRQIVEERTGQYDELLVQG